MVRFNDKKQATELSPEDILIMTDVSDSDSDKKVTMNQMATYVAGIVPSNLPSQSGHAGQYLKTDGTEPSWADVQSLPSQTGQAGKYLYSDGTDATWRSSYTPPLLSFDWYDHKLNDIRFLRADTFSWQYGVTYSAVYNLLLEALGTKVQMYCWSNADGSAWFWTLSETPQAGDKLYGWGDEYVTCDVGTVNNVVDNNTIYLTTVLNPNDGSVVTLNTNFTRNSSKDKQSYTCHFERFNGITVYVNQRPNGLRIAMPNQEQAILNLYNTTGVAWYYILDTTNQRFKLPRMKYLAADVANAVTPQTLDNMYLYFYVGEYSQTAIEQTAGLNAELFNAKVDLNASNLNAQGKSYVSGLGMPSSEYIDLTLGATGSTYTAPANGWFCFYAIKSTVGHIYLENTTTGFRVESRATINGTGCGCYIPARKNDIISCYYEGVNSNPFWKFYYAEGEV